MNKYMNIAIKEAYKGITKGHGGPFGAVVVKDDKVIAKGHNMVIANQNCVCHGEIMAIQNACKALGTYDLSGCDIYTTAEPCPMCFGAILWANISHIYYGCTKVDTANIGFRDDKFYKITKSEHSKMLSQLDHADCKQLFDDYNSISTKQNY